MSDAVAISIATRERVYVWSICANGKTAGFNICINCMGWSKTERRFRSYVINAASDQPLPGINLFNLYRTQLYDTLTRVLQELIGNPTLFVINIDNPA